MKRIISIASLVAVTLSFSACSTYVKTVSQTTPDLRVTLDEFEISDQLTAEGTVVTIFGIDWEHLFTIESGSYGWAPMVFGGQVNSPAKGLAIYNLIKENPGYDVVIYPQFDIVKKSPIGIVYHEETVRVTARLGKLKAKNEEPAVKEDSAKPSVQRPASRLRR